MNLTVRDNERILGRPLQHEALDLGDWRLVLWRAATRRDAEARFSLPHDDLEWLERTFTSSDRPMIVASHVPVSGQSQISNYYFDQNPGAETYPEAAQVRRVLRRATQPLVFISGHVHWNSLTLVDGIPHLTQQSLTERFITGPEPAGAFGLLTLDKCIDWQVFGGDPLQVRLDTAGIARRWPPPLRLS